MDEFTKKIATLFVGSFLIAVLSAWCYWLYLHFKEKCKDYKKNSKIDSPEFVDKMDKNSYLVKTIVFSIASVLLFIWGIITLITE